MKNRKYKIFSTVIISAALLLLSCKHGLTLPAQETLQGEEAVATVTEPVQERKTYLTIKVTNSNPGARTITAQDYERNNFHDFELKGKHSGGDAETLLSAGSLDQLNSQKIEVKSGAWEFTLSAKYNGIIFSDTVSLNVKQNQTNAVSFTLKASEHFGGLHIEFDVSSSDVYYAEIIFKKKGGSTIIDKLPFQPDEGKIELSYDVTNRSQRLESGIYFIHVDFYGGDYVGGYVLLNQFESYIAIADGLVSTATIGLDFNEVYTITYKDEAGNNITQFAGNGLAPNNYSVRSSFTFADAVKPGKVFVGWKDDNGDPITKIELGTSGNLNLVAVFKDPVLYVSGNGDDTTGDGWTFDTAFETIDKACETIITQGKSDLDWTIYICGNVTGPHSSTRKQSDRVNSSTGEDTGNANDYGRSIIPETITTEHAKSILVTGYNAPSSVDSYPQDIINRGLLTVSTYNGPGPALSIATEVPVTITNVKLTNARNSDTNPNTENHSFYNLGGGLGIGENSTVYIGNNVYIEHNKATYGGGIYNAGTLYIYGSACIGDKTIQTLANSYANQKDTTTGNFKSSNEYSQGGGIYNKGNLYLGYSRYVSATDNDQQEWTGGIYRSYGYSASGGGIYITNNSIAVMNSGTIAYNDGQSTGGGVAVNSGTFIMTGGTICHNSTGGSGGGVKVENDGVFYFGVEDATNDDAIIGPTISANWATGNGGGIYIEGNSSTSKGKVFMFGKSVVGDKTKTTLPVSIVSANNSDGQNATNGGGGGIYVAGNLYMGYSSYNSEADFVTSELKGGVYYNYTNATSASNAGGGGVFLSGNGKVLMNSGTIANNAATKNGGALYIMGNGFVLGGTATIPAGSGSTKQTVYVYTNNYSLNIDNDLSHIGAGAIAMLPQTNSNGSYNTYKPLIVLTDAAKAAGVTIPAIKNKFTVEEHTDPTTGLVTYWEVNDDGKAQQRMKTLTVSAAGTQGTYSTFAQAIAAMDDTTVDYILSVDGTINEAVTIPDDVAANSITIQGKDSTSTTLKGIIDASGFTTGSALTIQTTKLVKLNGIKITGGKGTSITSDPDTILAGGGIYIVDNGQVYIDQYSSITGNTSDVGAGIYVAKGAKLYMNTQSNVTYNTATTKGAGIYVKENGNFRIFQSSRCHVSYNKFTQGSTQVMGGGVYLEDRATMEQFGGYIHDNEVNTTNSAGGLGSGIFVSDAANYKILGYADLSYDKNSIPNDIYLQNNVQIEISDTLYNAYTLRRLTPQDYPVDGGADVCLLKVPEGKTLLSGMAETFEISPQVLDGGALQYWYINSNSSDGVIGILKKTAGFGFDIEIITGLENDINVSESHEGNIYTFTADTGYTYKWYIDGEQASETSNALTVNTSGLAPGVYDIFLEATKDGKHYSYTAQIKITN